MIVSLNLEIIKTFLLLFLNAKKLKIYLNVIMEPLKSNEIVGNWATLLLPIEENDEINFEKLSEEVDILVAAKVNGIYSNGTAGEFYNQTEDEFDKIHLILAEKCNKAGMPFQVGCSHMDPRISIARLKRAIQLRPSAIQIILPDWMAPSMDEIINYLKVMTVTADSIGLVLYNPPHAKRKLSPDDFYQILQAGIRLVGCKVAAGDKIWYDEMKKMVPELSLFVPGHHLATGIYRGANGAYSNVACLNPRIAQRWYELICKDIDAALELEKRIQYFMNNYIVPYIQDDEYSNVAADKFLASVGGWANIGTRLRWPYKSIPFQDVEKVRKTSRKILPEFFDNTMNLT